MMKRIFQKLENALRGFCGRITPDKRILVIAVLLVVFAAVNICVTFSAIYSIGREDKRIERLRITPLSVPDFESQEPTDLEQGLENYFNQHFNTEKNDTTEIESKL